MRTILFLVFTLLSYVAEAESYSPRGYITDILSYYPLVSGRREAEEIVEIGKLYGFLPPMAKSCAKRRVDMVMVRELPTDLRARLLDKEIEEDRKRLDKLPDDAREAIKNIRAQYDNLPITVKRKLIMMSVSDDKTMLSDPEIRGYIENHRL